MSEDSKKNIRLSKAAIEFNIGMSTIIEFLGKKGHKIDSSPNTKLNAEMYALLVKEFHGEKEVKKNADQLGDFSYKGKSITVESTIKEEKEDDYEDKEISIRISGIPVSGKTKAEEKNKAVVSEKNAEKHPKVVVKPAENEVAEVTKEVKEDKEVKDETKKEAVVEKVDKVEEVRTESVQEEKKEIVKEEKKEDVPAVDATKEKVVEKEAKTSENNVKNSDKKNNAHSTEAVNRVLTFKSIWSSKKIIN